MAHKAPEVLSTFEAEMEAGRRAQDLANYNGALLHYLNAESEATGKEELAQARKAIGVSYRQLCVFNDAHLRLLSARETADMLPRQTFEWRQLLADISYEHGLLEHDESYWFEANGNLTEANRALRRAELHFVTAFDHLFFTGDRAATAAARSAWGMVKFDRGQRRKGRDFIRRAVLELKLLEVPHPVFATDSDIRDLRTSSFARRWILLRSALRGTRKESPGAGQRKYVLAAFFGGNVGYLWLQRRKQVE